MYVICSQRRFFFLWSAFVTLGGEIFFRGTFATKMLFLTLRVLLLLLGFKKKILAWTPVAWVIGLQISGCVAYMIAANLDRY